MAERVITVSNGQGILLKKAISKQLYKNNFEQSKISSLLGITQPMVSNYISQKIDVPKKIDELAKEIVNKIIEGGNPKFSTTVSFSDIDGVHYIASENELITDEKQSIIKELTDAFLEIKGRDVSLVMPEVKMNIAICNKNAKDRNDVASFINGLIILDNKVASINSVAFGKSRHLADLLIELHHKDNSICAIMNIKYDAGLRNKFDCSELSKDFKIERIGEVLLHKGDFGIEPCAYIVGKTAKEVTDRLLQII